MIRTWDVALPDNARLTFTQYDDVGPIEVGLLVSEKLVWGTRLDAPRDEESFDWRRYLLKQLKDVVKEVERIEANVATELHVERPA